MPQPQQRNEPESFRTWLDDQADAIAAWADPMPNVMMLVGRYLNDLMDCDAASHISTNTAIGVLVQAGWRPSSPQHTRSTRWRPPYQDNPLF